MLLLGSGLSLVIALVLGAVSWSTFSASRAPSAVVTRYFNALSHGDAAGALAFAETPPTGRAGTYLTSTVLAEQLRIAPLSDVSVTSVSTDSGQARVSVRYRLGFAAAEQIVDDSVTLDRQGQSWRLFRVAGTVAATNTSPGSDRLTFVGRPVPSIPVTLFPGAIPVASDNPSVQVEDQPSVRLVDTDGSVVLKPALTTAAKATVATALDSALGKCLAASSTDPRCPLVSGGRPVPGSLHGTLTKKVADSAPTITLSAKGKGLIDVSVDASLDAKWKVWDFNNQQQPRSESTTVTVTALSSVSALQTIDWVASSG